MKSLKLAITSVIIILLTTNNALAIDYANHKKINQYPGKGLILDVPLIKQNPELPRGCEVTSLAMLLNYEYINVDKMVLAKEVKKDHTPYLCENGEVYFGNPNTGFVGDMYNMKNPGLGVYNEPIFELGQKYLPDNIINLTGSNFNNVLAKLNNKTPVWVIINTWYTTVPAKYWEVWNTPTGKIRITFKEHSVLLTGFDDKYVYFNDPLEEVKNRKIRRNEFEKAYIQMGKQAISYKCSLRNIGLMGW